jgi:hypothetical protein
MGLPCELDLSSAASPRNPIRITLFTLWYSVASSFIIEAELAADPITRQHVHLRGDLGHALAHPSTNQRHVPQRIGAYSLK